MMNPPLQRGVTIDSAHSQDLDDAIDLEQTAHGFRLTVTVPDLSAVVPAGCAMDFAAGWTAFTRYAVDRVRQSMLPPDLTTAASLLPDGPRPGIAFDIGLDSGLAVSGFGVRPVTFLSSGRLTHEQAAEAVRSPGTEHHRMLALAWAVAKALMAARRRAGALAMYDLRTGWMTTEEGRLQRVSSGRAHVGQIIVQEMMILTNTAAAAHARAAGIPLLYRNHALLASQHSDQTEVRQLIMAAADGQAATVSKPRLRRVLHQLGRAVVGPDCVGHFGLAAEAYCHVTSPLRRYADLVNQRILLAYANGDTAPYDHERLIEVAERCNAIELEIRLATVEGFKATVHRRAERALTYRAFDGVESAVFRQVLRIVVARAESGVVPARDVIPAVGRRLMQGLFTPQDIGVVLLDTGDTLGVETVTGVLEWLRDHPGVVSSLWAHLMDREGWPAVEFTHQRSGAQHLPKFIVHGAAAIDGEPFTGAAVASEKRVAEQLATLVIIAKIIGHEIDAAPDSLDAAEAPPPARPAWTDSIDGEPKGHLINKLAGKQGWRVAFDCTSTGPSHKPAFLAAVTVRDTGGDLIAEANGTGHSKRDAERAAALAVIPMLTDAADAPASTSNGPAPSNPVNGLQAICQRNRLKLPVYEFKTSGKPDGARHRCTARISRNGADHEASGAGETKSIAKANAAAALLEKIKKQLAQEAAVPC